ncbi:amidase [Granulicella arctica]|uniref:amidase n=1 Tax=Granulicella arctica TaxID=940613 RepID=UPI0021DF7AED|nr:amidase [Granulicella arctica]
MSLALGSAVEQLKLLRDKVISPMELAEEHIHRIERLNPMLNAIIDFDPDKVRAQARHVKSGMLSGLPITIKSSISVAGHLCETGSMLWRGRRADTDAVAVARLRAEGAIILGTTNCPEFLMAYETDNLLYGRTNNPWDLKRTAGGSSGGEAAAISAGLSAAGLGSDSGGSVREPAHFTGICSLKPTSGRVSSVGHLPPCVGPFSILGAVGPMARSVPDLELLFRVLSQPYFLDSASTPVAYRPVTLAEAKQFRIGYLEDDGFIAVTPETRQAVQNAVKTLKREGFSVEPFRPASLDAARKLWDIFFMQCGAMFYEPEIVGRRSELSPVFRDFLSQAESRNPLTPQALLQAWAEMDLVRNLLLTEMKQFPILLTPVCSVPAVLHGERSWTVEGTTVSYLDAMRYTQWFNLLGSPAAVVPVGTSDIGLPIGVQIAGMPFLDEAVLAVASVIDAEFGYKEPPIAQDSVA